MPPTPLHGSSTSSLYFPSDPSDEINHLEDVNTTGTDTTQSNKDACNRSLQQEPHSPLLSNDTLNSTTQSTNTATRYTTCVEANETGSSGIWTNKPDNDNSTSASSTTGLVQQPSNGTTYHQIGYGKQSKATPTSLLSPVSHHNSHHHVPLSTMPSPTTPPSTPTPTSTSSNRFGLSSSIRRRQQNQKIHNQPDSKPSQKQPQIYAQRQQKQPQKPVLSLQPPQIQPHDPQSREEQPTSPSTRRAQRHKKATKDYQEKVDLYYHQLTKGCGHPECSNSFCASARGGILQLHSQAARSLSMVLASSSSTAKLCLKPNRYEDDRQQQPTSDMNTSTTPLSSTTTTTPFFHSLQTSPLFTQLFGNQPLSTPSTPIPKRTITSKKHHKDDWAERIVDHLLLGSNQEETLDMIRGLFRHWEVIGNAFLDVDYRVDSKKVLLFYQVLNDHKLSASPLQQNVSESFEVLLDRMNTNIVPSMEETVMVEWSRSLFCLTLWVIQHHGSYQIWPNILTQKYIKVISRLYDSSTKQAQHVVIETLSRLGPTVLEGMVNHLHTYLIDHFHVGPYRHGTNDTVVMAVKSLLVFYQANSINPRKPVIPCDLFISETLCNKLNIKDEYRIWKRVVAYGEGRPSAATLAGLRRTSNLFNEQQRRSRLFLTSNFSSILLPYPFVNEYQFSWFSYAFLLTPAVKRKVLLMDCMSSMSMEYEDACVNHTLLVQAQRLLASDAPQMVRSLEHHLKSAICPYLLLEIRRQHFVNDTIHQLSRKWSDLKKPLKVKFVDGGEEGVDQGGVQKEFFGVLFEHLLDKDMGLFICDETTRLYWFRPCLTPDTRSYEMFGVLLGLAIYNGVILNVPFPRVMWKILCTSMERKVDENVDDLFTLDDLKQGWPQLAHGLNQLLEWSEDDGMTVEDVFAQNYELSFATFESGLQTVSLMDGGESIPVTGANRDHYVRDYCVYFMYQLQREAIMAVRRGLWCVIGSEALESVIFPQELEMITCGWQQDSLASSLDMKELEKVTEYDDGYHSDHPVIQHFWSIVHRDLTPIQKRKLLYFVTASDRVPVGGLKELTFVVQRNGPDSDRLPTALTCFSRLLLPEYANYEKLRDRLITSIENAKGFGLV